jgi:hypothetical protein
VQGRAPEGRDKEDEDEPADSTMKELHATSDPAGLSRYRKDAFRQSRVNKRGSGLSHTGAYL